MIDDPWVPGRNAGPSDATIHVTVGKDTRSETLRDARMLFAFEAEHVSAAIAAGLLQAPILPRHMPTASATTKCWTNGAPRSAIRPSPKTLPPTACCPVSCRKALPQVPKITLPGVALPVSKLILGCDNRNTVAEGRRGLGRLDGGGRQRL